MPAAPADLVYNTPQEITQAHQELRDSFASGVTYDVGFRKHQLKQLSFFIMVINVLSFNMNLRLII